MLPDRYKKYGFEWETEVMKNSKSVIVDMLRRVAIERDSLEAAQQSVQRTAEPCCQVCLMPLSEHVFECDVPQTRRR